MFPTRTRRIWIAGAAVAAIAALLLCSCGKASAPPGPPPDTEPAPVAKSPAPSPSPSPVSSAPPTHLHYSAHPAEEQQPTDDELLEQSLNQLKKGNLAYSTPANMTMGQTERVTARIGDPTVSVDALKSGLPSENGAAVAVAATPVSARMKMELKSADFDITPLSSEEQGVGGDTPTSWEWDISPKHSGTLSLHLAAVVELKNLSRDFTSIDRDVAVRVDPVGAVSAFMTTNWQWLIATLTAICGAIWKFLQSRKKKSNPDSAAAAGD